MTDAEVKELKRIALEARRHIVRSVHTAQAGHLGGPLSATDILVTLYFKVLKVDPLHPYWPDRDRFILGKGHGAIGLYSVLALRGYFPTEELSIFDAINSRLQGHPDMTKLPGIEMSSGSLGQGLSPGVGMALGAKLLNQDFRVWVLLGDGDAQEGQIWEAALVAHRYHLDNLVAILDNNRLQQFGWPTAAGYTSNERQPPQEDPAAPWRGFGWQTFECDGHDVADISRACQEAMQVEECPAVIIAHTTKGKGIPYMENDYTWHSKPLSDELLAQALADLDAAEDALQQQAAGEVAR